MTSTPFEMLVADGADRALAEAATSAARGLGGADGVALLVGAGALGSADADAFARGRRVLCALGEGDVRALGAALARSAGAVRCDLVLAAPAAVPGLLAAGVPATSLVRLPDPADELASCSAAIAAACLGQLGASAPRLRWVGDQERASSLATVNGEVCRALARDGLELDVLALDRPDGRRRGPVEVEVRHAWPPDFTPAAGRLALIQPWEYGALPQSWIEPLRSVVDELWVPSEHVAGMMLAAGVERDRVHVVPNGVDLQVFSADGPRAELPGAGGLRLLFVGGTIGRKGPDVLLAAYLEAFAGREDVTLVVKDVGTDSYYAGQGIAAELRALAESGAAPRVVYLDRDLARDEVAALYRACDVLVHPYRGEGFAMPVLEAMACGLPCVVTAGGPTDEFCPDDACWRIDAERVELPVAQVSDLPTHGKPWLLEPDAAHLVRLLRSLAADPAGRARRAAAARRAAECLGWDAVADLYAARVGALAGRPPRLAAEPWPLPDPAARNLLATPAWRGDDRLAELLAAWAEAVDTDDGAGLYLVADPAADGVPADWEARVLEALDACGADLERLADVTVLDCRLAGDDALRLHAAAQGYVPLHAGCEHHARLAGELVEPTTAGLLAWLGRASQARAA